MRISKYNGREVCSLNTENKYLKQLLKDTNQ